MTAAHVEALAAIERDCFADPWSETALAEELDNDAAAFFVAVEGGTVLGYGGLLVTPFDAFVTNVAVAPEARRRGVARAILAAFEQHCRTRGLDSISLEVRVSNAPAIALYEGAGYVREGVRPRFYRHPDEDAAIYTLRLTPPNSTVR